MLKKPIMYMLGGLPASGKSTLVKEIMEENPGAVLLSSDSILEEWAERDGITYDEAFNLYIKEAGREYNSRLSDAVNESKDIIVDRTNLNPKSRKHALSLTWRVYTKVIYWVVVEESVRQERLKHRPGKTIPSHVDKSMKLSVIEPTIDEGFDMVIVKETG